MRGYRPRSLPPVLLGVAVVSGTDPSSPDALLRPVVEVGASVNPTLEAFLVSLGAKRTTERAFVLPAGRDASVDELTAALEAVRWSGCYSPADVERAAKRGVSLESLRRTQVEANLRAELEKVPTLGAALLAMRAETRGRRGRPLGGGVVLRAGRGQLVVTVVTDGFGTGLEDAAPEVLAPGDLDTLRPSGLKKRPRVLAHHARALVEACSEQELGVVDVGTPAQWAKLVDLSLSAVVVGDVPGAPGLANVQVGDDVEVAEERRGVRDATEALAVAGAHHLDLPVAVAGSVAELAEMALAAPTGRDGLHLHQDHFCSVYAATTRGVVNALEPGMGKTVCSAVALLERSQAKAAWRGLAAVPAGLRDQWRSEVNRFFPQARVEVVASASDAAALPAALEAAGDGPVLVVVSHDGVVRYLETLLHQVWDDLVCDEAAFLRSMASARSRSLWTLRDHSRRAIALTGTPVEKGMADLAHVTAWALGDRNVNAALDVAHGLDRELEEVLGAAVFRRTTAEISGALPDVDVTVTELDPSRAHRALLAALHEAFRSEVEVLQEAGAAGRRVEANRARTRALSALSTLRAAACDPSALAGSEAMIVKGLPPGVLEGALREGGAKASHVVSVAAQRVEHGGRLLVCTDFPGAARRVAEGCREVGLGAMVLSGSQSPVERTLAAAAFKEGDVQVLCLSGAGRLGLNLQAATDVVHLDLPTSATQVTQRTARAVRLGSSHATLNVHVPVHTGSVDVPLLQALRGVLDRIGDPSEGGELSDAVLDLTSDAGLGRIARALR